MAAEDDTTGDETATIRRTLAEHRLMTPVQCRCGWRETDGHGEQWHEHAAAAVALVRAEETFGFWEGDHTSLVHVLWAASWDGLTLKDDFDEIASRIMQSKWLRAVRHWERRRASKAGAAPAPHDG